MTPESSNSQPDVWIAYYPDWSSAVVFASEIEALRYAVEHASMWVRRVEFGKDLVNTE